MKKFLIGLIAVMIVIAFAIANQAGANPLFFLSTTTSSATTSPVYMSGGKATTTLTFDAYGSSRPTGFKQVSLLLQVAATGTAPTLNAQIQYSHDGIDWYETPQVLNLSALTASSTPTLGTVQTLQFIFASSTVSKAAGLSNGAVSTSTRIVTLQTPTRYIRAVLYMPAGSAQAAVWGQFIAIKEND